MPQTTETAFNAEFANALRGKHPRWRDRIGAEQSGVFKDHSGRNAIEMIRGRYSPGGRRRGRRADWIQSDHGLGISE